MYNMGIFLYISGILQNFVWIHGTYILGGNSEIGAHAQSDIGQLICLRYLFRPTAVSNLKLFPQKKIFLSPCTTCFEWGFEINLFISIFLINIKTCQQIWRVRNSEKYIFINVILWHKKPLLELRRRHGPCGV